MKKFGPFFERHKYTSTFDVIIKVFDPLYHAHLWL